MIADFTQLESGLTNHQATDLEQVIAELVPKLTQDEEIIRKLGNITDIFQEIGKLFEMISQLGEIAEFFRAKCRAITPPKYKGKVKVSVKGEQQDLEEKLYKSLIQTFFPGTYTEKWLTLGIHMLSWLETGFCYTAADVLQTKLDLMDLGQEVGEYRVGQRRISGDSESEIFIKVLEGIELQSLNQQDLLQIEKPLDAALCEKTPELPSVTSEVEKLRSLLRAPQHWPLSLITSVKKFIDGVVKKRPVVNKREALILDTWNATGQKINPVEGQKLKGEYLSIRLEEPKHWLKISNRLSGSNIQLSQAQNRVWELAQEKQEEWKHSLEGNGRPAGKVGKNYCPVPWTSDVLEVLEGLGVEGDILALIRYDLGVFVEEYDWQIVVFKYKLDHSALTSLKRAVDEIAIENNRPLDPITGLRRPWKDDLYQVIQQSGRDATKLLKKEIMKYSVEEVEALVQEKTFEIKEQLEVTEQRLSEEQKYREQLQSQVNSLESKISTMQQDFEQKIQNLLNQFIAQTANSVSSNEHQLITVDS